MRTLGGRRTERCGWPRSTCAQRPATPDTGGTAPGSPDRRCYGWNDTPRRPPGRSSGRWRGSPNTAAPARRRRMVSALPPCLLPAAAVGELLDRAFTEQRLLDAWRAVRDAALADGEAGPEVERFEPAVARHLSELAEALRDGTFQPHPVVRAEIAKQTGGVRKLAVPTLTDRIVERALLTELDAVIDPLLLPWSFAYRHGLGVRDAVVCLAESR